MMINMILWTANWCVPCKAIKPYIISNFPNIQIMDVDDCINTRPEGLKTVPTLQTQSGLITGGDPIIKYLKAYKFQEEYQ